MAAPTASDDSLPKPKRPSSAQRGYGHDWRVFRAAFLKAHPVCCRIGCREPATDVDHEPELQGRDDPGRLDPSRCAPLCKAHHAEKTLAQNRDKVNQGKRKATAAERKKSRAERTGSKYDAHREAMADASREASAEGREIGPHPPVKNPRRRARGLKDPEFFHRTYFPNRYYLKFGEPHKDAIATLAACSENGGLYAYAMMRGGGKSTIAEVEVIRALLYGLRRYAVFVAATDTFAGRSLKKIFKELSRNELLFEDFPEVCWPIRKLNGIYQRARGQTMNDLPTMMEVTDGHIVLPTVPGSKSSGAAIQSYGLTGSIRGLSLLTADGEPIRPDLLIIDDAQTRDSAKSSMQTDERERIITSDILELAGPQTEVAAAFICTPIYVNDLTERFIDRDRHPEWQGTRTKMIVTFPKNMPKWDEYYELRRDSFRDGDKGAKSNIFYKANREAMDEGFVLSWPEKKKKGDISAIQSAMNLYYRNPVGFFSEYQCEPESTRLGFGSKELNVADVSKRLSGLPRGTVPTNCTRVTAFVDVGGELLWYIIVAWNEHFGGSVIDYGTYPEQFSSIFDKAKPNPPLSTVFPKMSDGQRVYAGLTALLPGIMTKEWQRQNGGDSMRVERCLVDSGWGAAVEPVYDAITRHRSMAIYPSKGDARSTTKRGIAKWGMRPGERGGFHWRLTVGEKNRGKQVQFDADAWKSFIHDALTVPPGGQTGLTFFGDKAGVHEKIAESCNAEYAKPQTTNGDTYDKWSVRPDRHDNDWWDCLVGAAVAASVAGVAINTTGNIEKPEYKKPISLREIQDRKRQEKDRDPPASPPARPPAVPVPTTGGKRPTISLREIQEQKRRGR